jgi:hypothetical protein
LCHLSYLDSCFESVASLMTLIYFTETGSKTFVTLPAESTPPETPEIAGVGDTDLRIIGRGGGGGGGGGGGAGGEGLCEVLETFENVLVVY